MVLIQNKKTTFFCWLTFRNESFSNFPRKYRWIFTFILFNFRYNGRRCNFWFRTTNQTGWTKRTCKWKKIKWTNQSIIVSELIFFYIILCVSLRNYTQNVKVFSINMKKKIKNKSWGMSINPLKMKSLFVKWLRRCNSSMWQTNTFEIKKNIRICILSVFVHRDQINVYDNNEKKKPTYWTGYMVFKLECGADFFFLNEQKKKWIRILLNVDRICGHVKRTWLIAYTDTSTGI